MLALVTNRDQSQDVVDILCKERDGNYFTFSFPFKPYHMDNGRSVRPQYIWIPPRWYERLARPFIKYFPSWVII